LGPTPRHRVISTIFGIERYFGKDIVPLEGHVSAPRCVYHLKHLHLMRQPFDVPGLDRFMPSWGYAGRCIRSLRGPPVDVVLRSHGDAVAHQWSGEPM
jgi:hypothetical protein